MSKKLLVCSIIMAAVFLLPLEVRSATLFKLRDVNIRAVQNENMGEISGTIVNMSDTSYKYVRFRLKVFDKHGNFINFVPIVVKIFPARSSKDFCEFVSTFFPADSQFVLTVKEYY